MQRTFRIDVDVTSEVVGRQGKRIYTAEAFAARPEREMAARGKRRIVSPTRKHHGDGTGIDARTAIANAVRDLARNIGRKSY